jgi:hypothetical protein
MCEQDAGAELEPGHGPEPSDAEQASTIRFHYIKSPLYRNVVVSGVHGGVTPSGRGLHMALFSERGPIPQQAVHELVDGRLGQELLDQRVTKQDVVREVEVGVHLDWASAQALAKWLEAWLLRRPELEGEAAEQEGDGGDRRGHPTD